MRLSLILSLLVLEAAADVVIVPGGEPKAYRARTSVASADAFFRNSVAGEFVQNDTKVIISSLDETKMSADSGILPSSDSFVRGAIQAWGEHHHLVVRADEVWFSILVQMNFYMGTHAEEIRHLFVDHEGKETILVEDFTWQLILEGFQYAIQDRVKTDWLREWILPNFSTTQPTDHLTATVLMMGLMQAYFNYEGRIICGLPSVTLLGEQSDWEKLLAKLDRLKDFGPEPTAYGARLRPILEKFVQSFKQPDSAEIKDFWQNIVIAKSDHMCGSPPFWLSGWITGFWYWNQWGDAFARGDYGWYKLGNITYPQVDIRDVPVGYAKAPLTMLDYNDVPRFEGWVLAGAVGKRITQGAPAGYDAAYKRAKGPALSLDSKQHSTLQPMSAWMIFGPAPHKANATRPANRELSEMPSWISSSGSTCFAEL